MKLVKGCGRTVAADDLRGQPNVQLRSNGWKARLVKSAMVEESKNRDDEGLSG